MTASALDQGDGGSESTHADDWPESLPDDMLAEPNGLLAGAAAHAATVLWSSQMTGRVFYTVEKQKQHFRVQRALN